MSDGRNAFRLKGIQTLRNNPFQRLAFNLLGTIKRATRPERTKDTRSEEERTFFTYQLLEIYSWQLFLK